MPLSSVPSCEMDFDIFVSILFEHVACIVKYDNILLNKTGGVEYDGDGNIASVKVLRGAYIIQADVIDVDAEYVDPSREEWERKADSNINDYDYEDCTVIPYFGATFGEEFGRAIGGDVGLFGAGYTLIIIYAAMALGKRDYVHSMMGIAGAAIVTVLLSIVGSYGFAGALGIIFTPLSGSLPFLILGLGVDDAFIIVGEFQQVTKEHPTHKPSHRMDITMKHAGVSILIKDKLPVEGMSFLSSECG